MDDRRFDALTRAMAQGASRRTAIKGLLGGVLGSAALGRTLMPASAQPECENDDDCLEPCSVCVQGQCVPTCDGPDVICCEDDICYNGNSCCLEAGDECGGEQLSCCNNLLCCGVNGGSTCAECCGQGDCGPCSTCVDGTCVSTCGDDEKCCEDQYCIPSNACCTNEECGEGRNCCIGENIRECAACCWNGDCPQGNCQACIDGTCQSACPEGYECCNDTCVAIGFCCQSRDEACMVTEGPGTQGNCCNGLLCCPGSEGGSCAQCCDSSDCGDCQICDSGTCIDACTVDQWCCYTESGDSYCAECCDDDYCSDCAYCDEGICHGKCSQSQECCDDTCVELGTCCQPEGSHCGEITLAGGSDGPQQYDCCDGLLCCFGQATNICAECCSDSDCDAGGTCEDWVCVYPGECKHDHDCPHGTCCCDDGDCSRKCCPKPHPHPHPHPKPPKPSGDGSVTTLPATGSGSDETASGLLGAAALGAATLFAAKKLREDQGTFGLGEPDPTN